LHNKTNKNGHISTTKSFKGAEICKFELKTKLGQLRKRTETWRGKKSKQPNTTNFHCSNLQTCSLKPAKETFFYVDQAGVRVKLQH
jgi:hypothetical protein